MSQNADSSQHRPDPQQLELLRVCRIGRAQGLKGEVTVQTYTDEPEQRFAAGSELYTQHGETMFTVQSARVQKNRWIVKFADLVNRDDAEALNGTVLYGEADDADEMAEEDAWYPKDLIGLDVLLAEGNAVGAPAGRQVGKVVDVIESAQWLLKVRLSTPMVQQADGSYIPAVSPAEAPSSSSPAGAGHAISDSPEKHGKTGQHAATDSRIATVLVPFVDQIVPGIDLEAGCLTLDPPGGLIPGL